MPRFRPAPWGQAKDRWEANWASNLASSGFQNDTTLLIANCSHFLPLVSQPWSLFQTWELIKTDFMKFVKWKTCGFPAKPKKKKSPPNIFKISNAISRLAKNSQDLLDIPILEKRSVWKCTEKERRGNKSRLLILLHPASSGSYSALKEPYVFHPCYFSQLEDALLESSNVVFLSFPCFCFYIPCSIADREKSLSTRELLTLVYKKRTEPPPSSLPPLLYLR